MLRRRRALPFHFLGEPWQRALPESIQKAWRRFARGARIPNPIPVVRDGIDARVMSETAGSQNLQGPERILRNGIAGRPVTGRRHPAGIFDGRHGALGVSAEFRRGHLVNRAVCITVTADFVTGGPNGPSGAALMFGHPTQNEESGLHLLLVQQVENARDLLSDAGGVLLPERGVDERLDFRRMKIFFDIDRQGVEHRPNQAWRNLSAKTAIA